MVPAIALGAVGMAKARYYLIYEGNKVKGGFKGLSELFNRKGFFGAMFFLSMNVPSKTIVLLFMPSRKMDNALVMPVWFIRLGFIFAAAALMFALA